MQQMQAILDRITARRTELGLSESAVAARGGSRDLIRNWRRALENGRQISARYESLAAIARALDISEDWLIHGEDRPKSEPRLKRTSGFADAATPFSFAGKKISQEEICAAVRALFGPKVVTPALYRVNIDQVAFGLVAGDIAVVDLARLPVPGEIAIASVTDEETASAVHTLCRYAPPLLLSGQIDQNTAIFRVDDPGVAVRHPVAGSIRGLASI